MAKALFDVHGLDMSDVHSRLMRKVWMSQHNHERREGDYREHDRRENRQDHKGQQQRPTDNKPAAQPPPDRKPATIMNKFKYDGLLKMAVAFAAMAAAGWFGWPMIKPIINGAAHHQAPAYGFAAAGEAPMLRDLVHRSAERWRWCDKPQGYRNRHCGPWHEGPPPGEDR